jgi:Flp pilus assembly protein TadG
VRPRQILARAARRGAGDTGSSDALGLALLAPAAIGLAVVIVFLGRGVDGRATTQMAAEAAAQAAAQERTPAAADRAAREVAARVLVDHDSCASPSVAVDTSHFVPGGQVAVTVTCTVSTRGLELIAPPSGRASAATAYATIDRYRGLGPSP